MRLRLALEAGSNRPETLPALNGPMLHRPDAPRQDGFSHDSPNFADPVPDIEHELRKHLESHSVIFVAHLTVSNSRMLFRLLAAL
jgi:hypothetical protein